VEKVIGQLKEINSKLDTIISVLKTPENKMVKVFEIVATGVGVLGILSIIDIIRTWMLGG
jgi:hypothetical protein